MTSNGFKRENSHVIYSIDAINAGIKTGKRIQFQMVDYDMEMNEVLRYEGAVHEASPYALIWNNDYYYMIAMPEDGDKLRTYRVDRMKNTKLTDEDAAPRPADFRLDKYSSRVFDMYSGDAAEVLLECKPYVMNYLIDRFGKEFRVVSRAEDSFVADIVVDAGPTFYAWVFQFGGDAKIVGPDRVVDEFNALIDKFR